MRFLRKPTLYGRFTFRKTKVVELMNKNGGSNPSLSATLKHDAALLQCNLEGQ